MGDGKALAHGYRILHQWNEWLTQQFLGSCLIELEQQELMQLLNKHFGKNALLIGVPNQHELLSATSISQQAVLTPLLNTNRVPSCSHCYIETNLHELPILTGSIDLVLLPHTLEFVDTPRQLLAEACRIVRPEGLIVICGFNPYSLWGLKKFLTKQKMVAPWAGNFIHASKIKNWLQLVDFFLEKQKFTNFKPPITSPLFRHLDFLEKIGSKCFPMFGGVYMLFARAKVIPLTPIKLKWKQQLSGIGISTTIRGHIARSTDGALIKKSNERS